MQKIAIYLNFKYNSKKFTYNSNFCIIVPFNQKPMI